MCRQDEAQWLRPHQMHNVTLVKIDFRQDSQPLQNYSSQGGGAGVCWNSGNDAEQFSRNFPNWLKRFFFFSPAHFLEDVARCNWKTAFLTLNVCVRAGVRVCCVSLQSLYKFVMLMFILKLHSRWHYIGESISVHLLASFWQCLTAQSCLSAAY